MLLTRIVEQVPTDPPTVAHAAAGGLITFGAIWTNVAAYIGEWPIWAAGLASVTMIFYYSLSAVQLPIVQQYLKNRRERIRARKLARLKARALRDEAKIQALMVVKHAQAEAAALVETARVTAKVTAAEADATSTPQK